MGTFLDMVENHKRSWKTPVCAAVAALKHLDLEEQRKVVSVTAAATWTVITMSSVVQQGLILETNIFTVSVLRTSRAN